MVKSNPHNFNPPPYSNPNYPVAQSLPTNTDIVNQVHRWAYWLKFAAIYMMISSSIQFLKNIIVLILTPDVPREIYSLVFGAQFGFILAGSVGFKVSENKYSQNAIKYLIPLLFLIIGSSIVTVSLLNDLIICS